MANNSAGTKLGAASVEVFIEATDEFSFAFASQAPPHWLTRDDEAAFKILHKKEDVGLLIKHEPECLGIGHAIEKSDLGKPCRRGSIITFLAEEEHNRSS